VMAALLRMGPRAIPRLARALQHSDPRVRMQAARALRKAGAPPDAVPALEALLDDPNPLVRETAAEALEPRW
jgi:HEAT repeat protein